MRLLTSCQEARGDRAIDDAMIGGERGGHHRPHRDTDSIGDGTRRNTAHRENSALRRIDDRDKSIDAKHAEIGDGESSAFVIER